VSLDSVRRAILKIPGVLSVHELHVWQLSESEIVASVHVTISEQPKFMHIAKEICETLHEEGIHFTTIQPEYDERSCNGSQENLKVRFS
jgi:solute carrier family 30 (zinc transporter), member 1